MLLLCVQALAERIKADAAQASDEKLSQAYNKLKGHIQAVANAPVSVSLSDEQKKEIIRHLEERVSKLERR